MDLWNANERAFYICLMAWQINVFKNVPSLSKSLGLIFISIFFIDATMPMKEYHVIPMYLWFWSVLLAMSISYPIPKRLAPEQCQVRLTNSFFSLHEIAVFRTWCSYTLQMLASYQPPLLEFLSTHIGGIEILLSWVLNPTPLYLLSMSPAGVI